MIYSKFKNRPTALWDGFSFFATVLIILFSFFFKVDDLCFELNLTLNFALADCGTTFSDKLSTFIFVNSKFDGGINSVPLSRDVLFNFAIIFAAVWIWTGLAMTILSAAYKALPQEIIEAAIIDGATPWQRFWRLVLPMLSIPITFLIVVMIINALKMIDLVYVMTMGGPRGSTRVIGYSVYIEMFANAKIGYGSAIGAILLILIIPIIYYQVMQSKKQL